MTKFLKKLCQRLCYTALLRLTSKFGEALTENSVLDNYVLELEVRVNGFDNDMFVLSLPHDQ